MAAESTASAGLKFQYVRAISGVKMPGNTFRVLMVYWDHARADLTNSYPKRETVWKEAAISPNSADAATKWLRMNGWLTLQRKAVGTFANSYRLTVPAGIEWEGDSPKTGYPVGHDSPEVGHPETGDSPEIGESTPQKLGTQTPQKLGSHNRPLNRSSEQTTPSPRPAPVQQEPGPVGAGEGDSFQEWIDLFPSSKRKNLREARAKYGETINGGITHQILIDSTRAYLEHEQGNEGGKYIGQAVAVLTDRRWEKHKPKPDPNLTNIEAQRINRDRLYPEGSDMWQQETEGIETEEQRLIDRQGYVRDGHGNLRKPELTPEQKKAHADYLRHHAYLRYS
ncbi:MAG: hypothetical protein L0G94_15195 [Brachybacterium sp.]|uniref:hypothetical protein n=1 Tax=Brachybacterium sp. TaxID=1891286 RepID=UPI0026496A11|nr:hypothetical protein [Brachybacterium sp.]MDN5688003.1 hypothetical protein [Brachybacterium sp.]